MSKILCIYCDNKKCNCGGERKKIKERGGDVIVRCEKCRNLWIHFHRDGKRRASP